MNMLILQYKIARHTKWPPSLSREFQDHSPGSSSINTPCMPSEILTSPPSKERTNTRKEYSKLISMKGVNNFLATFALLALASTLATASDPSSLQDFCVALNGTKDAVFVNGKFCKDPKLANADDFFLSGLDKAGNTSNAVGSKVTPVNVDQIPGLNTLGISLARIDFAPHGGQNPPHTHPRGSEILVVAEGTLYVGFVTSNPDNRLFTKVLKAGDVFVFPVGLIHFQVNVGNTNAVAVAALSSQNPGVITIANAVFGSNPPIYPDILAKAFKLDKKVVEYLETQF